MITIALDTATDHCSVAAGDGTRVESRAIDGARRHGSAILPLLAESLDALGATPRDIGRLVVADGPGSFTGLRVASAVAKALGWRRDVEWLTAPSLLVRAVAHAPAGGGVVLALSDALRGELYAGCWSINARGVSAIGGSPRAMLPEALAAFGAVDVVVGTVPEALTGAVELLTSRRIIGGAAAMPDAATLLELTSIAGGTTQIRDIDAWEPAYGRPAEAQAVWERKHGRSLPTAPGIAR